MKNLLILMTSIAVISLFSCEKEDEYKESNIDFEEIDLGTTGYWNGSDGSGGITSGNAYFRNYYDSTYNAWSGFAVSNRTDKTTSGYTNQYSSVTGSGAGQSKNYAVMYSYTEDTIEFLHPQIVTGISFSNSTYAYQSMKKGDMFAKKFGGSTGDDPDYFCVVLKVIDHVGQEFIFSDSLFLADYRFTDNSKDYIFDGWVNVNLSAAGYIKYIILSLDSSDKTGEYINTPTYICIDNIKGKLPK